MIIPKLSDLKRFPSQDLCYPNYTRKIGTFEKRAADLGLICTGFDCLGKIAFNTFTNPSVRLIDLLIVDHVE